MTKTDASSTSPNTSVRNLLILPVVSPTHPDPAAGWHLREHAEGAIATLVKLVDAFESKAASTSSAEKPWAAIFCRFHSIHLNRLIDSIYRAAIGPASRVGCVEPSMTHQSFGGRRMLAMAREMVRRRGLDAPYDYDLTIRVSSLDDIDAFAQGPAAVRCETVHIRQSGVSLQISSAYSRRRETVWASPWRSSDARYSSTLMGCFFKL